MPHYTSLKIKLDNPEMTLNETLSYWNGYAPQHQRREKEFIYFADASIKRLHTMKLLENDISAANDHVKTIIAELPASAGLPLFKNNMADIRADVEDDRFARLKRSFGEPDCVLERDRRLIYKVSDMENLQIFLDTDILLNFPDYKKFVPAKGFLEFKIAYSNDLTEKQHYLWDLAQNMHFTVDQFDPRPYHEMRPHV